MATPMSPAASPWADAIRHAEPHAAVGRVIEVVGLTVRADGPHAALGALCEIETRAGPVWAEVVGFHYHQTWLMVLDPLAGLEHGARVRVRGRGLSVPVGRAALGRLLDGIGRPRDGRPAVPRSGRLIVGLPRSPLLRRPIKDPLWTGVRIIDGCLTLGQGQRIGIFSGSGVGKSTLLKMLVAGVDADAVVVALVGERGREVAEFWQEITPRDRRRTVVVAATSDEPALLRLRAAETATGIAEDLADGGSRVLLVVDSLTRAAMAAREVGIAAGEPPTARGYTPSVFAMLPRLLERAGRFDQGAVTGCYTVLVDGDDLEADPVADAVRGVLDGHIVLSRERAEAGEYPAVDLPRSLSRTMDQVVARDHRRWAARARDWVARAGRARDLVELGAYAPGADPATDEALRMAPALLQWGVQAPGEATTPDEVAAALAAMVEEADSHARA
jgi:flagellum-specific ATP synthase